MPDHVKTLYELCCKAFTAFFTCHDGTLDRETETQLHDQVRGFQIWGQGFEDTVKGLTDILDGCEETKNAAIILLVSVGRILEECMLT